MLWHISVFCEPTSTHRANSIMQNSFILILLTITRFAGDKYISIEYPMKAKTLCTVHNVRCSTVIITMVSLLCGLPKSFDYYFKVYEGWTYLPRGDIIYTRTCLSGFTAPVRAIGPNTFFNFYFWTRVCFILIPSLLLIVLNLLLIRGVRKAQQRKQRLLSEKRAKEAQHQNESNSTSLMLIVIVSIFLIVNLPQAIFMGLLCVCTTFGIYLELLDGILPAAFLLANNMLVMATYPVNFGIYCFMSSSFRHTFKAIFCRSFTKEALGSSSRNSIRYGTKHSREFYSAEKAAAEEMECVNENESFVSRHECLSGTIFV
ncbi:hypothetical protein AB6A40_001888 [Gnathostoma spinigerum]|uniref:G-protein coupled receptors family 1 profile domain-containing protein n=1 Tax=Gnathostoma spinigerum TaxID=75299 RepID=A0ABD6E596_9BILA